MSKPEPSNGAGNVRSGYAPSGGARLYYELRGEGPLLLLIPGASGDAGMYERAAECLAGDWTAVTYDRRGNSRSSAPADWTATSVDEQADDAAALLRHLDRGPAAVFGNSSGATIAINLCLRHPEVLQTVVAHEPPKIGTLPDRDAFLADLKARMQAAVDAGGYPNAMRVFHDWLTGDADGDDADLRARVEANGQNWVTRELGVVDRYDAPAELIAARTTPLTVAIGNTGGTELHTALLGTYREALRQLAESLRADFVTFSGAHVPYETVPETFAAELTALLRP